MKKTLIIAVLALVTAGVNVSAKKTVTMTETPASDSRIESLPELSHMIGQVYISASVLQGRLWR